MSKTPDAPRGSLHHMRVLAILLAGQAMASMDVSILIVASPNLRLDLGASGAQLELIVSMYTVAFAGMVVTGARLGDVLGRRRTFLVGLTAFTIASLAAGLAPTPDALIVARGVQGSAAAVMTPQVLSIIQLQFDGEVRARAIGAYSMILSAGVALGQILGGLLVSAHLIAAAWRPALLINAPIGVLVLLAARRGLPDVARGPSRQLDGGGAAILSAALLALVLPFTLGRAAGWPPWIWPALAASALLLAAFAALERRIAARGGDPLFDLGLLARPRVAAGVAVVVVVVGCYAGFLVTLTLHLQDSLGFSALHCGLIFSIYAGGFATASLTWTRASAAVRDRLPVLGLLAMGTALLTLGLIARGGGWQLAVIAPLLFVAGAGHACGFSPLANGLATAVRPDQAADLSGLIMTASLIGQVLGIATFVGIYLGATPHGSAHALALTTAAVATMLIVSACAAARALAPKPTTGHTTRLPFARRS
jgi:MFS family permease